MIQEKPLKLSPGAWVSRLWSQYNALPEHFKAGFAHLAQSAAQEAHKQQQPQPSASLTVEDVE